MFFLRSALFTVVAVGLLAVSAGCDETGPSVPDAEAVVGTWTGTGLNVRLAVASGVSLPVPGVDMSVASVTIGSAGAISFAFDPADDATIDIPQTNISIPLPDEASLTGTYVLDDQNDRITVTRAGVSQNLVLKYKLRGDNDLEIIAEDADALSALLGLAGPDAQQFAGLVAGGSIRYNK